MPTAEYVSNRLGEETIVVRSGGTSTGKSWQSRITAMAATSSSSNASDNWQQHGRKLLKPEEILMLSDRIAITFTPGVPPIWTTLVRYFEERNLARHRDAGSGSRRWRMFVCRVVDTAADYGRVPRQWCCTGNLRQDRAPPSNGGPAMSNRIHLTSER